MKLTHVVLATVISGAVVLPAYANQGVTSYGLMEVEASTGDDHTGASSGDIALATVELGVDFSFLDDRVAGSFVVLHENDAVDKWEVDQAFIRINRGERVLYNLSAGRMYVPFGSFETSLLSDPLTLEIGEMREEAVQIGFETGGLHGAGYIFDGDLGVDNKGHAKSFGFNLGYEKKKNDNFYDLGVSWVNHIGDANGLQDAVMDTNQEGSPGPVKDYIPAYALNGIFGIGPWFFIAEYVQAIRKFQASELMWKSSGARPGAHSLEVGYNFEVIGDLKSSVAFSLQGTDQAAALGLPENRWLIGFSTVLNKNISLAVEYAGADDYSISDGGTGSSGNALTLQMTVEL